MPGNLFDETLEALDRDQQPNPFLETLELLDQAQTVRLRGAFRQAAEVEPEQAAEARRLSLRFGVPPSAIQRDLATWRKRARVEPERAASLRQDAPALAGWLEQPENAAVASDDLDALIRLEQAVTFGAAIKRGIDQVQGLTYSALEATAQAVGSERLEAIGRAGRERNRAEQEAAGPRASLFALRSPWDLVQWAKETIGEQIPIMGTMLAGAGTGAAVGSVVPGVGTTIGAVIGAVIPALAFGVGETQETIKAIDPDADVPAAAFIGGSAIAAFDTILPGRIGGRLVATFGRETAEAIARRALLAPVKASFLREGARGMATEGVTEAIQEAIGNIAAAVGTDTSVSWSDTWRQMVEAGAAGALVGGLATVGETAVTRRRQAQRAAVARQQQAIFEALASGVADSELVKRLPEAAQDFLAQVTRDGPLETLYAPTETWVTYWQSQGVDPAAVAAELTGNRDALTEATSAGTDLAIPTAAYAVKLAVTPHHAALARELRLDPAAMNVREAEAFEAAEREAPADVAAPPPSPIVEALRERLAPLGFDESAIEAYAALQEAFFQRQAERVSGGAVTIDPVELFERYGLTIERADLERLQRMVPPSPAAAAGPAAAAAAAPVDLEGRVRQLEEELRSAQRAAEIDALTGVANRAALDKALATAEGDPSTAVVVFDANNFGTVNKQVGHEAGDAMLREMAGAISDAAAEFGMGERVFRRGGDEFVVLAPTAQAAQIRARAEALFGERTAGDVVVSLSGTVGRTFAEADAGLQARKRARKQPPAEPVDLVAGEEDTGARGPEGAGEADRGREGRGVPGRRVEPSLPPTRTVVRRHPRTGVVRRSVQAIRESPAQLEARRQAHLAALFDAILDAALQVDPTVDAVVLREEFDSRLSLLFDLDETWREDGQNPRHLLEAIAAAGGISLEAEEGGYSGELAWVRESSALGPFGEFGGVRGVFRSLKTSKLKGFTLRGHSLDGMADLLRQDQEFSYIEGPNELLLALENVARGAYDEDTRGVFPGTDDVARVGIDPATAWWELPESAAEREAREEGEAIVEETGDAGFEITELEQAAVRTGVEITGQGHGQLDGFVAAVDARDRLVGRLDFSEFRGDLYVRMVEVLPEQRRQGIASQMVEELRREFPDAAIRQMGDVATEEGRAFAAAVGIGADVTELGQPPATPPGPAPEDVLETGEVQPRLPGDVGAVREQDVRTPELGAPFALTPEAVQRRAKQETLFQAAAFHGSPHLFDRFSLHAIGSGEGGQAYGWGLYFASLREIADRYRENLAGAEIPKGLWFHDAPIYSSAGIAVSEQDPLIRSGLAELHARAYWKKPGPDSLAAIRRELEASLENYQRATAEGRTIQRDAAEDRIHRSFVESALAALDKYGAELELRPAERPGRTYKVEIPEDEDFLDWDRPLSVQSPTVQRALEALGFQWDPAIVPSLPQALRMFDTLRVQREAASDIGIRETLQEGLHYAQTGDEVAFRQWFYRHSPTLTGKSRSDITGEQAYEGLAQRLANERTAAGFDPQVSWGKGKELASKALNAQGVAGIRFLDGFSRAAGDGTHNYVVFDDRLIAITEFDQPAPPPAERATLVRDEPYQTDLFGEPLPDPGRPEAGPVVDVRPGAVPQRDDVEGEFATRTQLVSEYTLQLDAPTVLTPQDAATALSGLARGAQERFDAIVTDAEGTPLGIVGSFKGAVDESHVHPSVIVAEAFRLPDAAAIWFVHNHPSGAPELSDPDRRIAARLADVFHGSGITAKGFLAVGVDSAGRGRYQAIAAGSGPIGRRRRGPSVPVLERELVTTGKLARIIRGPQDAAAAVPEIARGQFGAVLLDARHQPIGFLPFDPAAAAQLRTGGRLDALYRGISVGNPSGVIIHAPQGTTQQALNLANAFHAVQIQVLDVVEATPVGPRSLRELEGSSFDRRLTGAFEQARRGAIRFGPDRRFTIQLFAQADLSTFLHESAHFFFEVFADLADQVRAADAETLTAEQRQMRADYDAILAFMGVENRGAVTREHHERFARAFEAYLLEGKAPDLTLRSAFARFRAWLLGIYRSLRGLNVTLNDQVRAVFDRMLAGEDAIAEARAEGVRPLFTTADEAGMTEREFGLYRAQLEQAHEAAREALDRRLMVEVQREREAAWKARRDEIEGEVSAEVYARPVYRALAAIQRGTNPDGSPLEADVATEPMRLSRAVIVDRFGEDRLRALPPFSYMREGGLDPDTVAELFGFSSGDALLTALAEAQPMRAVIREQVDARMVREHGSLLLDGSLHELARAAVANEDRDQVVRAELRALANLKRTVGPHVRAERQAGAVALAAERKERAYERRWLEAEARLRIAMAEGRQQVEIDRLRAEINSLKAKARGGPGAIRAALPPQGSIRASARERIARTRIRDIRPQQFWTAAAQASRRAVEAAARQDFDVAIAAKQQELLSLALYREGVNALDEVERRVARAKALARPKARQRLGLAGESYLDQIDGILDRYEFARVSEKALERRASIAKWAAAIEGEGLPVDLPDEVLDEARRVNYRTLTVEQLIGVTDAIEHIAHLARLKTRLLRAAETRQLDQLGTDLAASIRLRWARRPKRRGPRDRRPAEERRRLIESFFASHRKISSYAYELDGFTEGGPFWEAVVRPLNEAGAQEAGMLADASRALHAIIDRAYPGAQKRTLYTRVEVPAVGESMSKMERLLIALYWGNVEGRNRILENEGWTTAQVEAVLDGLDARDWRFVEDVWGYLESFWPQIVEKEKRVTGVAPVKVEALPIRTRFGDVRGGYVPLRYDDRESAAAAAHADLETASAHVLAAYLRSTSKRGFTKERARRVNRRLRLRRDFGVVFEHVQQVVHDLTHHEALIDVGRVLGHAKVQDAIYNTLGDIGYKQFKDSLRDIAIGETDANGAIERAFTHIRIGATAAMLGWNLTTGAFQVLGLTQSMVRVGPKWVMKGVSRWLRDAATMENTARWITERSAMMRTRFLTQQRDVRDALRELGVQSGRLTGWVETVLATTTFNTVTKQRIVESYFWVIQVMQRVVDIPTWLGAFEKARADGRDEASAIAIADQAVLDTQGGGQIKDLARVQRGGPMLKLWMTFGSFFNTTYNQATEATRRTRWGKPLSVWRLGVDYMLLFIVPASLGYILREALRGESLDEDDDRLVEGLIRENLSYLMGILAGLRELGGVAQGFAGYEGPAGARVFASAGRAVKQAEQVVRQAAETGAVEETLDEPFWRSLNETAGILFHYPSTQMWRTAAGLSAWLEGRSETPVSLIGGPPREEQ